MNPDHVAKMIGEANQDLYAHLFPTTTTTTTTTSTSTTTTATTTETTTTTSTTTPTASTMKSTILESARLDTTYQPETMNELELLSILETTGQLERIQRSDSQ